MSRKGICLCVPNLGTLGGKIIAGAFVVACVFGVLVLRSQSMHLKDVGGRDMALATASPPDTLFP
jgi:hypothetical protein